MSLDSISLDLKIEKPFSTVITFVLTFASSNTITYIYSIARHAIYFESFTILDKSV